MKWKKGSAVMKMSRRLVSGHRHFLRHDSMGIWWVKGRNDMVMVMVVIGSLRGIRSVDASNNNGFSYSNSSGHSNNMNYRGVRRQVVFDFEVGFRGI